MEVVLGKQTGDSALHDNRRSFGDVFACLELKTAM